MMNAIEKTTMSSVSGSIKGKARQRLRSGLGLVATSTTWHAMVAFLLQMSTA